MQQVAWVDTETGECGERQLRERFYREGKQRSSNCPGAASDEASGSGSYHRAGLRTDFGHAPSWLWRKADATEAASRFGSHAG